MCPAHLKCEPAIGFIPLTRARLAEASLKSRGGKGHGSRRKLPTAKEAAGYLRISLFTLRKIEQQGLIVPYRTPGGHRRYSLEMLNEYLEKSRSGPTAGQQ